MLEKIKRLFKRPTKVLDVGEANGVLEHYRSQMAVEKASEAARLRGEYLYSFVSDERAAVIYAAARAYAEQTGGDIDTAYSRLAVKEHKDFFPPEAFETGVTTPDEQ